MEVILVLAFIFYVIFSLSTIKHQNKLIIKHLDIKEEVKPVTEDEIIKELKKS